MPKFRSSAIAVMLVLGTTMTPAYAAIRQKDTYSAAKIVMGDVSVTTKGFVVSDGKSPTTYLPLDALRKVLQANGYFVSWNASKTRLDIRVPEGVTVDLKHLKPGHGSAGIYLNGTLVQRFNPRIAKDPISGASTVYIPIWYFQQVLKHVGLNSSWLNHVLSITPGSSYPVVLTSNKTYGSLSKQTQLKENLIVLGTNVTVQNVKVQGSVYLNPGPKGNVVLNNVTVIGRIVVESGATASIHLNNVQAPALDVVSSTPVHIVTEGNTSIQRTDIAPADKESVILDQAGGTFGSVVIEAPHSVTLSGTRPFTEVQVQAPSTVNVAGSSQISSLTVAASNVQISISSGASVSDLTVKSGQGISVQNNGTVGTLNNQSSSGSVQVGGNGTVTKTQGNPVKGSDNNQGGNQGGGSQGGGSQGGGSQGGSSSGSGTSTSTPLSTPQNVHIHDSILSWDAVPNATGYKVTVKDRSDNAVASRDLDSGTTSFDLLTLHLNPDTYTVRVQAKGDGTRYTDSPQSSGATYTISAQPTQLSAPEDVHIDGTMLIWNAVDHATSYKVTVIEQGSDHTVTRDVGSDATSYDLSDLNLDPGTYTVKVQAKGDGTRYTDSPQSSGVTYIVSAQPTQLSAPEDVHIDGTMLIWNAVDHATGYKVTVIEQGSDHTVTRDVGWDATSYDLSDLNLDPGTYSVSVQAIGDGTKYTDSPQSSGVTYTVEVHLTKLSAPQNVKISGARVSWDAVENAMGYTVTVTKDGNRVASSDLGPSFTSADLLSIFDPGNQPVGVYTVTVQARGDGTTYSDSEPVSAGTYTVVDGIDRLTIKDTQIDGMIVSWSAVTGAWRYFVKVTDGDGKEVAGCWAGQSQTSVDLRTFFDPGNRPKGTYTVTVTAIGDGIMHRDSEPATAGTYTVRDVPSLSPPTNVKISGTTVTWNAVPNSNGYEITVTDKKGNIVSGGTVDSNFTSYNLWTQDLTPGDYSVTVKAFGDGMNFRDSEPSESVTFTVVPLPQLNAPENVQIKGTTLSWDEVTDATGYTVTFISLFGNFGTGYLADSTTFDLLTVDLEPGTYLVTVTANGDGIKYRNSEPSTAEVTYTIAQLPPLNPPQQVEINGTNLSWDPVQNARGYTVTVSDQSGDVLRVQDVPSNVTSFDLSTLNLDTGTYFITVKAKGSRATNGDSEQSEAKRYTVVDHRTPLDVPNNVHIDGTTLKWDAVQNAESYEVTITDKDGKVVDTQYTGTATSFDLTTLNLILDSGTYNLTVTAIGDGNTYRDSEPSNAVTYTVVQLPKLNAPENVRIAGTMLTWDEVTGATGYMVTVTGQNNFTDHFWAESASLDLSILDQNLDPGTYELTVTAVGDDKNYRNSDPSSSVKYKVLPELSAPQGLQVIGTVLRWNAVEHANGYTVTVTDVNNSDNSYSYWVDSSYTLFDLSTLELDPGIYTVTVTATGDGNTYRESEPSSETVRVAQLPPLSSPEGVKMIGTMLQWDPVVGAMGYIVTVTDGNNVDDSYWVDSEYTSLNLWTLNLNPGTYNVTVRAIGDGWKNGNSLPSNPASYTVNGDLTPLNAPEGVKIIGTMLKWEPVDGASGYIVTVSDENNFHDSYWVDSGQTSFDLSMLDLAPGTYDVMVTAVGNAITNSESPPSSPAHYTVIAISADLTAISANSDTILAGGQVTVTVVPKDPNGNALGRDLGVEVSDGTTIKEATWNADNQDYEVTFTENTPGMVTFSATVNGVQIMNQTYVWVTEVSADWTVVWANPSDITVGDQVTVTVVPTDADGYALGAGLNVDVSDGTTTKQATWNADNQDYEVTFTENAPGTVTFSATVNGVPITNQAFVKVFPVVSADLTTVSATPSDIKAGEQVTVAVVPKDANGYALGEGLHVEVSDGTMILEATWNDDNQDYEVTFTEYGSGTVTFSAKVNDTAIANQAEVTVQED
jgi:hypothetical protein